MIARGLQWGRALATSLAIALAAAPATHLATGKAMAAFPDKPIRFVIPFPAGGGNDIVARALAEGMAKDLGQQVLVESKPGAGTVIGTEYVATRAPDGYTILMVSFPHSVNPSLLAKLPYDPATAFTPVALIARFPNVVVVPPDRPYKTMAEVLAYAKANPGKLNYGSPGNGTSPHLCGELFKVLGKVDMVHVPYKGAGPAIIDLLGGRLDVMFSTAAGAGLHVRSGKLRAIAVTAAERSPAYPDLPTVAEAGVAGFNAQGWYGIVAPAGTPADVIARLNASVKIAAQTDVFIKRSAEDGLVIDIGSPEDLAKWMSTEEARWRRVVREVNIKPD